MKNIIRPIASINSSKIKWLFYTIFFCFSVIALFPRFDELSYEYGKYLWAEDGNIFLNQAQELSFFSLFKPYAGYLHVYPRVVTLFSHFFDFLYRPTVLFAGWFFSYFILIHAISTIITSNGGSPISVLAAIGLASLQPSSGEVFFNITNSQWMLGAALALYSFNDQQDSRKILIPKGLGILIASLTGPFSIVIGSVLILKLYINRDFKKRIYIYIPIYIGALIQLIMLLNGERLSETTVSMDIWIWMTSFLQILFFSAKDTLPLICALIIFLLLTYFSYDLFCDYKKNHEVSLTPIFLLLTSVLFIISGLISQKDAPSNVVQLGAGNRYSWVPYVLIFISITIFSIRNLFLGYFSICLSAYICHYQFSTVPSSNIQLEAFTKYSKVRDLEIPINPQTQPIQVWHIFKKSENTTKISTFSELSINPEKINYSNLIFHRENSSFESINSDPILIFKNNLNCIGSSHAALEIHLMRDMEGWMQLFWSDDQKFNEKNSLRRWYLSGETIALFAFPINSNNTQIRFDPQEGVGNLVLKQIKLYCL